MDGLSSQKKAELRALIERLKKLRMEEVLAYWINSEIEEAEMYNSLANKVSQYSWDERIEKLFRELARESLDHAEALLREYKRRYSGPLPQVDLPSVEVEFSEEELEEKLRNGRLEELLGILMASEKFAWEVYEYLANNAEGELRNLFAQLARVESGHYRMLENLLNALRRE